MDIEFLILLWALWSLLILAILTYIITKPKTIVVSFSENKQNGVQWQEFMKLREYWVKPQDARWWIEFMRSQRGYELYTLIPPNNGNNLVHLLFRKVRQGRGFYNLVVA